MKDQIKQALEKAESRGGYYEGKTAHTWLRWQNERIEQLEDAVESLYQLIQRGDLTSFDLTEADSVLKALGREE